MAETLEQKPKLHDYIKLLADESGIEAECFNDVTVHHVDADAIDWWRDT